MKEGKTKDGGLLVAGRPVTFTPEEVAAILKIDPQTVTRMIKRKELQARRVGKFYRIEQNDFEKYLAGCAV